MADNTHCPICETLAEEVCSRDHGNDVQWKCPRCGNFRLLGSAHSHIHSGGVTGRSKISSWVFNQNKNGNAPKITRQVLEQILFRPLPTVGERSDRLLLEALRGQGKLGTPFDIREPRFLAATCSQDDSEVRFLLELLAEQGLIGTFHLGGFHRVLPAGYIAADRLTRRVARLGIGFVAMWFDPTLEAAYDNGFQVGIMDAGYDSVRVDRVEHTNRIDDEIITQIKSASFVVADFTGHRGGVYFEAGFALGMDLPVIWTCRKDDMGGLHFDIRQYNTIDWQDPDELASRLRYRIEASVGKGPKTASGP